MMRSLYDLQAQHGTIETLLTLSVKVLAAGLVLPTGHILSQMLKAFPCG